MPTCLICGLKEVKKELSFSSKPNPCLQVCSSCCEDCITCPLEISQKTISSSSKAKQSSILAY